MQLSKGPESLDLGRTVSRSRSTSMSSDSQMPRINLSPPTVTPAPSFIASSAAAQIVTADQEFNAADFVANEEDDGSSASALVTPEALSSLNGFLDHLLFNILASSKSTQLELIRPAVADVLKPRLAKEVVSAADEELSEYMGGPEDEQFGGPKPESDFDLIRSWKLTRLRCMVYTRLGDMEEDDEEEYIAQDGLSEDENVPRRFSSHVGFITPAAAIFLTSIIEFIGERALVIAGETARSRLSKLGNDQDESTDSGAERGTMDKLVVGELDMEKLALNPTMGRLWRTWRRRVRTPNMSRISSRESMRRRGTVGPCMTSRKSSIVTVEELPAAVSEPPAEVDPASVALPTNEHDVQEIEIPGFHSDVDSNEVIHTMQAVVAHKVRPRSLMVLTLPSPRSPTYNGSSPISPIPRGNAKPSRHARSRSLPSASAAPCAQDTPVAQNTQEVEQTTGQPSPTPSEKERYRLETMYEHDEDGERAADDKSSAVNSPVLHEAKRPEIDSLLEESTGQDTAATSPLSTASVEVVTSQPSSTRTSSPSSSDRYQPAVEVIEGQGTCEKPRLASVQRPKRQHSKESSRKDDERSATPPAARVSSSSDRVVQTVVEDPPLTQGADSTPPPAAVSDDDSRNSDAESLTPVSRSSTDDALLEQSPRPVSASGESGHSDRSRTRPRPSPLTLTSGGSLHSHGRSSPGISSASSGTERAAVQRLSGRPSTSIASSSYAKSRRSDSFSSSREKRPVTAGSTTSQVSNKLKGLIGRQGETGPTRLRSSSETSRGSGVTGDSSCDDKTGLDDLIRSEETIHYTLTPKNMREIEKLDSPRWRTTQPTETKDLAEFLKTTGPPGEEISRPRTSNVSSKGALDLQPVSKSRSSDLPKHKPVEAASMSPTSNASTRKPSTGSTRDFANLMKSSGPPSPNNMKSRMRRFSESTDLSKKLSRPSSSLSNNSQLKSPRLQARPAAGPKGDDKTSDLIDFIREGPPTVGAHRIPRTVAPFRDTMDSDDLQDMEPNNTKSHAPSVTSTQDESMATKSMTSVGSNTGLLESGRRVPGQVRFASSVPSSSGETSNGVHPVRKQRRVPDPYAIDDSDDDEELAELLEGPKPPQREEESLIDFLRNGPPPPPSEPTPQPQVAAPAKGSSSAGFGSASAMKARFLRNTNSDKAPPPPAKSSKPVLRPQADSNYVAPPSNYAVKVGMERNGGTSNGAKNLPSVSERQTETSALAEFLRSTGPPEPPVPRTSPAPSGSRKDSGSSGFSRLFARRKKVEV